MLVPENQKGNRDAWKKPEEIETKNTKEKLEGKDFHKRTFFTKRKQKVQKAIIH